MSAIVACVNWKTRPVLPTGMGASITQRILFLSNHERFFLSGPLETACRCLSLTFGHGGNLDLSILFINLLNLSNVPGTFIVHAAATQSWTRIASRPSREPVTSLRTVTVFPLHVKLPLNSSPVSIGHSGKTFLSL